MKPNRPMTPEPILMIDDDPHVLDSYVRQFRGTYNIHTAEGGQEGLDELNRGGPYAVVVSDYSMPQMDGITVLSRVHECAPDTVRIMLTGQGELGIAMDAVNRGAIFRFLTKPCDPETLALALDAGIHQYRLIHAEKELLERTLAGSVKALADVLSLVNHDAMGRAARLRLYVKEFVRYLGFSDGWKCEIAAALSQIGSLGFAHGSESASPPSGGVDEDPFPASETDDEHVLYEQSLMGAKILANIPRLEDIVSILTYQHKRFDGSGCPVDAVAGTDIPVGARLLKVAADFDELRMRNMPRAQVYQELTSRDGWYDPDVLSALKALFVPEQQYTLTHVALSDLRPDMIPGEGIFSQSGQQLVAKGQELSAWMIEWLQRRTLHHAVREPIAIMVLETSPQALTLAEQVVAEEVEAPAHVV